MRLTRWTAYCIVVTVLNGCGENSSPVDAGESDAGSRDAGATDAESEPPDSGLPPPPEACPALDSTPVFGDVNGDGAMNIADAIALQNTLFRAGPQPVCSDAADFNGDGRVEADDSYRVTTHLVTGAHPARRLPPGACDGTTPWPRGQCAPLAFEFVAPSEVRTGSFTVKLAIRSPSLFVQGWSVSLYPTSCTIARVTTEGTTAAEIFDDPPGIRHLGYSGTTAVPDGAVSYVILSFQEDIFLPTGSAEILTIELEAPLPAADCVTCFLTAGDGLAWMNMGAMGKPLEAVIVAEGRAYRPATAEVGINVCAP